MAAVWTAPRTATTGELETAAFWNTYVRDNEEYLKSLFDVSTGHSHDGSTIDAGPKVDADLLDGQHGAYYDQSAHADASEAVHGLPEGVHVLGCHDGGAHWVQTGSCSGTPSTDATFQRLTGTLPTATFPVAFSSTPVVLPGHSNGTSWLVPYNVSTTGFKYQIFRYTSGSKNHYVAIGT